jgi:hypothetical protein
LKAKPAALGVGQVQQTSEAELKVLNALTAVLGKFVAEGQEHDSQGEGRHDLCFVNATVSGLKVAALVDTGATHSLISERTVKGIHCKAESSKASFKMLVMMK